MYSGVRRTPGARCTPAVRTPKSRCNKNSADSSPTVEPLAWSRSISSLQYYCRGGWKMYWSRWYSLDILLSGDDLKTESETNRFSHVSKISLPAWICLPWAWTLVSGGGYFPLKVSIQVITLPEYQTDAPDICAGTFRFF
jgi:hypothetical protein